MNIETILGICGGIVLVGNAGGLIFKWIRPTLNLTKRVSVLEEHDCRDFEKIESLTKLNETQCMALLCLINHMIDDNGVEEMKKTRELITQTLLHHK